jgi:hypothetical protein
MRTLNPIEHIRERKDFYIRGGVPSAQYLAAQIIGDALYLGAQDVSVKHINEWWVVSSSRDWLSAETNEEVISLFTNIVPFPEAGVNSMRSEILLVAFAKDVISARNPSRIVISGTVDPNDSIWQLSDTVECERIVGFRGARNAADPDAS